VCGIETKKYAILEVRRCLLSPWNTTPFGMESKKKKRKRGRKTEENGGNAV
jgi:hypothetical protein